MKIPAMEDAIRNVLEEYGLTEDMSLKDCVEKQIARKPILLLYVYKCPSCEDNFLRTQQKFCDECGQKLDWSEVLR